jgi:hypothetical protein
MKKVKIFSIVMASVLFVASCKKMDDVKPLITVSTPVNGDVAVKGKTFLFKAKFSDNRELSQYKIDIHGDFDIHGHTTQQEEWETILIGDLSGKEQEIERTISVPADIKSGTYHFIVECTDKAGNSAVPQEIDLVIIGN